MARVPTLLGVGGSFRGETYALEHFKPYIVGRSRSADISLRRTQHYRMQSQAERDADDAAKTVSARHFQITFFNSQSIELKNLSVNGTRVDNRPVGGSVIIKNLVTHSHTITFGADGLFKLVWREAPVLPAVEPMVSAL